MSVPDIAAPGRVKSRGSLLHGLATLRRRVLKYGMHRAATDEERQWTIRFYDQLEAAEVEALRSERAQASLRAFDAHRRVARKVKAKTDPPGCPTFNDLERP